MPAPRHYRVTFDGIFGTATAPYEIWSFGVSLGTTQPGFLVRSDLEQLANELSAHWSLISLGINATARLQRVRVAAIAEDGRTPRDVTGAYVQGEDQVDLPGTATGALTMPLQVALSVRLDSDAAGPTGRGRYYLPAPAVGSLEADGRINESARDGHAARAANFLNAINTTAAGYVGLGPVVVASAGSASRGIDPALNTVRRVGVGRVLDTQRRRRGDLDEAFEFTALA